jgi:hypothetical protein
MAVPLILLDIKQYNLFFDIATIYSVTIMPPSLVALNRFPRARLLSSWPGLHNPAHFKEFRRDSNPYTLDIKRSA